jgi:hypothetical protein
MMSLVQTGFSHNWKSVATKPTITKDGYFLMKGWQRRAFDVLIGKRFRILNAPMGSGKSVFCCYLAAQEMQGNDQKVIIAVPQTIIANGFRAANLEFPDGSRFIWTLTNQFDLFSDEGKITDQRMVERAVAFLKSPVVKELPQTRIMLCSHMTLVKMLQYL